jgi:HEAT repeat protein
MNNLTDPDKNKRNQAALEFGTQGDPNSLPELLAQLSIEPDFFTRETLIWAVVRMGNNAIAPLSEMLNDTRGQARLLAAQTLGKIGDASAIQALLPVVHDPDLEVARRATYTLGQIGHADAIPTLLGLLDDPRHELRSTITKALEQVGKANIPALTRALQHEHWNVREQIAEILGLIGDSNAIPNLEVALQDLDARVRFAAVTALGHINGTKAKAVIALVRNDPDFRVRTLAQRLTETTS